MLDKVEEVIELNNNLSNKQFQTIVRDHFFSFSKECSSPVNTLKEISRQHSISVKRDLYGNHNFDELKIKADKSRISVNILKLFKPGELLSSITTS